MPDPVQSIIKQIEYIYPNSNVNSCHVNKYVSDSSFLPEQSDDEVDINPMSNIFTITFGSARTVVFKDKCTSDENKLSPKDRSLYVMSRGSQELWTHRIDKCPGTNPTTRYSLTFR